MGFDRLHLGCGLNTPEDWLNVDGSWNARLAKHPTLRKIIGLSKLIPPNQFNIKWNPNIFIHDVRNPLPFENDYFRFIYSSHLLEHLYWQEGQMLLIECLRVLKPGGVLRIVVPDLKAILEEYNSMNLGITYSTEKLTFRADRLNDRLLMHNRQPPSRRMFTKVLKLLNGSDFHTHKWMYDSDSLTHCFQRAGFTEIQEMSCHKSRISDIKSIENQDRVINGAGVVIEGIKPGSFFPGEIAFD